MTTDGGEATLGTVSLAEAESRPLHWLQDLLNGLKAPYQPFVAKHDVKNQMITFLNKQVLSSEMIREEGKILPRFSAFFNKRDCISPTLWMRWPMVPARPLAEDASFFFNMDAVLKRPEQKPLEPQSVHRWFLDEIVVDKFTHALLLNGNDICWHQETRDDRLITSLTIGITSEYMSRAQAMEALVVNLQDAEAQYVQAPTHEWLAGVAAEDIMAIHNLTKDASQSSLSPSSSVDTDEPIRIEELADDAEIRAVNAMLTILWEDVNAVNALLKEEEKVTGPPPQQ